MAEAKQVWPKWAALGAAVVIVLAAAAWASQGVLARVARDRAMRGMRQSFASDLEVARLDFRVFPRLHMTGEGILLHYQGRRDLPPLISIRRLTADDGLLALLSGHIRQVRLEGLEIQAPPKPAGAAVKKKLPSAKIAGFVIDEIVADGTVLKVLPREAGKEPLEWRIRRLTLHGAGPRSPMQFRATLDNAKPPGEIESTGKFGPWDAESPGDTPVEGDYTFQHADLSVFRGIMGTLSSEGRYRGVLARIEVEGKTDTPDFALKVAGNPVDLKTEFHAIVDGTDGDTQLEPVNGQFGHSSVMTHGSVVGTKGVKGKTVSLDVTVEQGRLEDMLQLAVKGPPAMSGAVSFRARLTVPPGGTDVAERIELGGEFQAAETHFAKVNVQEKIDKLSHGAKAEPRESPDATVASDFAGRFQLADGVMHFPSLSFGVPGVRIALSGRYGLLDDALDFHGTATLEAKLSQTTTGVKSFLLKAVDPFFEKKKATGAVIPLHIGGTGQRPTFGLDLKSGK